MALQTSPQSSQGVLGAIKGVMGLFTDLNKAGGLNESSNIIPQDEYESKLSDEEIVALISQRKREYSVYYSPIQQSQQIAFEYWLGKQRSEEYGLSDTTMSRRDFIDNLIFEAVETFLPIATRANPDPLVTADPSEMGQKLSHSVKVALVDWADTVKLRRKLARATRNWTWGRLGVVKIYWNVATKTIDIEVINPKRMMFDKDGYVDEGGVFKGEWEAEIKKLSADKLIEMFPKKEKEISKKCKGKLGTKLEYIEWWNKGTDVFYTLDEIVLGKYKNPNWNYDGTVKDENGNEIEIEAKNHLKERTSPYRYLSIFSTGLQPHDETSLILQNIPLQDSVNTTNRQIEKNVSGMNNGMIVSGKAFTEAQASEAASALRRGVSIRVPNGDVREAVMRFPAPALPADVFNHLQDMRNEIKNIFGTSGSSPQGLKSTESVRGKILINQLDSSRIGGAITEQIEQLADSIYNLVTQFMFVYYDEEHSITTAGSIEGTEMIKIKNTLFPLVKSLNITVKEGSLVPKDPLTQRNEAVDLWTANAIDPLSLYKKLDWPDPTQATQQLILWQLLQKGAITPEMYLPSFKVNAQTSLPTEQPGTGDEDINAPTGKEIVNPTEQMSQGAIGQQSKDLLGAVKI